MFVPAIFILACYGTLVASRRTSAYPLAWAMVAVLAAANLLWLWNAVPWIALVDLPVSCWAYALVIMQGRSWQVALAAFFIARMPMHVAGQWGLVPDDIYKHTINALFLGALIAISYEGGRRGISNWLRSVRRFRARLAAHHALSARGEIADEG